MTIDFVKIFTNMFATLSYIGMIWTIAVLVAILLAQYLAVYTMFKDKDLSFKEDKYITIFFLIPYLIWLFFIYDKLREFYINYKQSKSIKNGSTSQH